VFRHDVAGTIIWREEPAAELYEAQVPGRDPDARLVVLQGADHGLYRSEAPRYTAEIINFTATLQAEIACDRSAMGVASISRSSSALPGRLTTRHS
jgi:hypothetical protein